jgi:hypothetical protein
MKLIQIPLLFLTLSCQSGMEYIPTVRVSAAIASDYSASLETLGYSATLDYEESSEIILGIGVKEKDSSGNVKSL